LSGTGKTRGRGGLWWPLVLAVALLVLATSTSACRKLERPKPDIRGVVTAVERTRTDTGDDALGSILVIGTNEPDTGYDRAQIAITRHTRILESAGATRRALDVEGLRPGQRVEVRFSGPVRESYPVQAMAAEVLILP